MNTQKLRTQLREILSLHAYDIGDLSDRIDEAFAEFAPQPLAVVVPAIEWGEWENNLCVSKGFQYELICTASDDTVVVIAIANMTDGGRLGEWANEAQAKKCAWCGHSIKVFKPQEEPK